MWVIVEFIALAAIVLFSITEFFYPLLAKKKLFGSFRKGTNDTNVRNEESLDAKIVDAKIKVQEVKVVQDEVSKNFDSAKDLKNKSDNLLK